MDRISNQIRVSANHNSIPEKPADKKAWLFGSCSRGEETPESDIDLLVAYDENAHVSLLTICKIRVELRNLLNRDVDVIEDGYLRPFAVESANHDKIMFMRDKIKDKARLQHMKNAMRVKREWRL